MLIKRRRSSDPRERILKGIFHDNLRIQGKETARPRMHSRRFGWARVGGLTAMMLTLILGVGYGLGPWRVSEQAAAVTIPATAAAAQPQVPGPVVAGHRPAPPVEPAGADLLAQIPIWDFAEPADQHLEDFRLLLSRDNQVRLSALFGLEIKAIVIDPGHGGHDPGAIGGWGTKEKDITLDVGLRLRERLARVGHYQVLMTREDDRFIPLIERAAFARQHKADLFISVHVNSLPDVRAHVIETYYFGAPLNSETLHLAETENKESGYALGEINAIIEDIGSMVKRQESARLASAIQTSLFRNVKAHDDHVRNLGIKMAPFVVLAKVEVPSVLVEISCLTKESEEARLMSPAYREKIAGYMEEGVVSYLEINKVIALNGEKHDD